MAATRATDFGPAFDDKPAGIDRRQLLRAGAWAAPALILATAAPAAAAQSGTGPTTITVSNPNAWMVAVYQGNSAKSAGAQGTLQIEKQWAPSATSVGPFTIVITVPRNRGFDAATPTVRSGSAPGWTAVSGVVSGLSVVYTFLNSQVVNTGDYVQLALNYALPGDGKNMNSITFPVPISQTVTATNGTGNTTTGQITYN